MLSNSELSLSRKINCPSIRFNHIQYVKLLSTMKMASKFRIFYVIAVLSILFFAAITVDSFKVPSIIHYQFLGYALIAQIIEWLLLSMAWQQTVFRLFGNSQKLFDCFSQLSMVMVGKYIPGKIWGMLARGAHLKGTGLEFSESLIATYIEQILFVHTGVTLGALAWYLVTGNILWLLLLLFSLLGITLVPVLNVRLMSTGNRIVGRWLSERFRLPDTPLKISISDYAWLYLFYTIHWLADLAIPTAVFLVIATQWPSSDLLLLLAGANAFGIILGFFAFFAPGGVGVREGVIVAMMLPFIALPEATLFVIAYRLWLVFTDLLSLAVVFIFKRLLPVTSP